MQFHFAEECDGCWRGEGHELEGQVSRCVNLNARGKQG